MKQLWIAAALAVLVSGYTAMAADAVVPSLGKWTLPADTTQVAGEVAVRGSHDATKISAFYKDKGFKNGDYYLLVRQNQAAFAYASLAVIPQERVVTPRYDRTRPAYRPVQKEQSAHYQVPEQRDRLADRRNLVVYRRDAKPSDRNASDTQRDRLQRNSMTQQMTLDEAAAYWNREIIPAISDRAETVEFMPTKGNRVYTATWTTSRMEKGILYREITHAELFKKNGQVYAVLISADDRQKEWLSRLTQALTAWH